MSQTAKHHSSIDITAENIGGIDETSLTIEPGVTILTGRNATNRTSLMRAIMGGLGSDDVSIKGNRDQARVEIQLGDRMCAREFIQGEHGVQAIGEDCVDDIETAELFAFLLETNEARRAIELASDLRELVLRPVDFDALEAEIRSLEHERDEIDQQLADLDALEDQLVSLESTKAQSRRELEETREALAAATDDLEALDADVVIEERTGEQLDELFDELRDLRRRADQVESDIEIERESLETLDADLEERTAELESLSKGGSRDPGAIEDRIDSLRAERRRLQGELRTLQNIEEFVREMIHGADLEGLRGVDRLQGSVTDELVAEAERVCWACGSVVEVEEIEDTLQRVQSMADQRRDDHEQVAADLDTESDRLNDIERVRRQRDELDREIQSIEEEIATRQTRLDALTEQADQLTASIADLDARIDALESEHNQRVIKLNKEINRHEIEVERLTENIETIDSSIEEIEDRLGERANLKARKSSIDEELIDLRLHVKRIEEELVEAFNHHMDQVLSLLEFENIERIWIRRLETGDAPTTRSSDVRFEVNIARLDDEGQVYEDSIEHLSESERKVTGLIFALAGYLVHEVHELTPVMLLDSLEAIDASRIAVLIDYFSEYAPYLVVALLPEDAERLDGDYQFVSHSG